MTIWGALSRSVSGFQYGREIPPNLRWALPVLVGALATLPGHADAQEPPACLSPNAGDRPAPARPYFLVIADTSGSMTGQVGAPTPIPSSCGLGSDRRAHLRCALRNAFAGYSGQVNFGLGTFPRRQTCSGSMCFAGCGYADYSGSVGGCGSGVGSTRRGLVIRVPVAQDAWWQASQPPSNTSELLRWVDGDCTGGVELFADGSTPLNGALRDARRYFEASWTAPDGSATYQTPLSSSDRACRSVNVVLITEGEETCDSHADAVAAAADLHQNGVTIGTQRFPVRVHVVNFLGGNQAATDAIAAAGGTGSSVLAATEAQLATALSAIVAAAIPSETCDNVDNDCNGCTDDGSSHYCHAGQACCAWATTAQRAQCLANYQASISPADPDGDTSLLPCTTTTQRSEPASWLCYEPVDTCDGIDNDCDGSIDEGQTRCGSPLHCPVPETCNGLDDDCDGVVDDGVCGTCVPSAETCDGCDNDCDGIIDEGIAPVACGLSSPAHCSGMRTCAPKPSPGGPGACVAETWSACGNAPQPELCDGVDNDCNGIVDDGVPPVACVPSGTPGGLVYGGSSQCAQGRQACGSSRCEGFVGPSAEICDGIDNDCDGTVDEGVPGVGQSCGTSRGACTPGTVACIGGALVCTGGVLPQPEICDGIDNDCDDLVDDGPLADAPPPGAGGCWDDAGTCCSFAGLSWCPPAGATCTGIGTLSGEQCAPGRLACVAGAWACRGAERPSAEACNGLDDDCDGEIDEHVAGTGAACGSGIGECRAGVVACTGGALVCAGEVPPSAEACNGLDDDCDGEIDDGLPSGAACTVPFDTLAFPGERTAGACRQGVAQCDGSGGTVCAGGVGPSPELCNGIDDDCDGRVDEVGPAPDGIDGTASPLDAEAVVGAACGSGVGECAGGVYVCASGVVACSTEPDVEACNCLDDDCDGARDEDDATLCGTGRACSEHGGSCGCRTTCEGDEDCPVGWRCDDVTASASGAPARACVRDLCASCESRRIEADGVVVCAPEGTELSGCVRPPVCVCTEAGCGSPCAGVTCPEGTACAERGPEAGACIVPRCPEVPCVGCGRVCAPDGTCVADPCAGAPCAPGETCVPSEDLLGHRCEDGDAGVPDAGPRPDGGALDGGAMGPDAGALESEAGGCGCAAPGRSTEDAPWALGLALAALVAARRRRRASGRGAALVALALVVATASGCGDDGVGTEEDAGGRDAGRTDGGALDACVPAEETCNGRDDDCDGTVDEVDPTDPRTCGGCGNDCTVEAVGCLRAEVACDSGQCVCMECAPGLFDDDGDGRCERECDAVASGDASCDGRDSDCDGRTDEDVDFCALEHCGGCGTVCSAPHATMACEASGGSCRAAARCVIEACECSGPGDCWFDADGDSANGCEHACTIGEDGAERCNGRDDDCDGIVDEAVLDPTVGVSCAGDPDGLCAQPEHAGIAACVGGAIVCSGEDVLREGELDEVCNGLDDDCDGIVDEEPSDAGTTCGSSAVGACRRGRTECIDGALRCVDAIEPADETCNGADDDCDGVVDEAAVDVGDPCNVPIPPPAGATSPCRAGTLVCTGGELQCTGAVGPSAPVDACGEDSNCDGVLTGQPDLTSSVDHCGACGTSCQAGAVHARWACVASTCQLQGCEVGYYDLDGDRRCEYACTFVSAEESCNGVDDDCDGRVDENVVAPSPVEVCGVSPAATAPECTTGVAISCSAGAWQCTFPTGVCVGGCSSDDEICDALDNDCDGLVNETTPRFGLPCGSDDDAPGSHGPCRTTGTYVCAGPSAVTCSAVKADCATLPGGCTEVCDGIDNDCDGTIDDTFANRGSDPTHFVRPDVTRIASSLWMYSFEASRPNATSTSAGSGNGYWTSAPPGERLDHTAACSVRSRIPWTGVTPEEASQVCAAMGGHLCTTADFQTACGATQSCQYGYAPRGAACTSSQTTSKFCNLDPFDYAPGVPGDQDALLETGSSRLASCWADWTGLQGNTSTTGRIYDITGNAREITAAGGGAFVGMGGSYLSSSEAGAACSFTGHVLHPESATADLGFRCCFTTNPTL